MSAHAASSASDLPKPGSVWRHHSGTEYTVIDVTDEPDAEKADKFPVTVFYRGPDGRKWPRKLPSFLASFTHVRDRETFPQSIFDVYLPHAAGTFFGRPIAELDERELRALIGNLILTKQSDEVMRESERSFYKAMHEARAKL